MVFYCTQITPRVTYMAQWLGNRLFGKPMPLVSQQEDLANAAAVFNYSHDALPMPHFQVLPQGLLFENDIHPINPEVFSIGGLPAFFPCAGGHHPFDLLAAGFYLISRYEEYLPHKKDEYGRYCHTNSLAWHNGFLKRPLVDEWMAHLKLTLKAKFPNLVFLEVPPRFIPTYDIDLAWSYLGKGWWRNIGGGFRDIFHGQWRAFANRCLVLAGLRPDPFAIYQDLENGHELLGLKAYYFVLMAQRNAGYDKNILPHKKRLKRLIRWLSEKSQIGIHLSWQAAGNAATRRAEMDALKHILGTSVVANRMHYINVHLPQTYAELLEPGLQIAEDWSMGYGAINGFRASTSLPFFWYNLEEDAITPLQVLPFAWMDANSIFEQKDSPEMALAELQQTWKIVKATGGQLVTIGHNHLLGHDTLGRAWWKAYWAFLREDVGSR